MIGIVLWLIVIFIIACASCPGFLTALLTIGACYTVLYWLVLAIKSGFSGGKYTYTDNTGISRMSQQDRENAIREWERKWGRTHPSRQHSD